MLDFIYDGSFEGLLTAVYEAYYRHQRPDRILKDGNTQQGMFDTLTHIPTDTEKADRVYNSIREKISPSALENTYHIYLSEVEDAGTLIYNYLRLGWKIGKDVDNCLSDDTVLKVVNLKRKVAGERHRLLGLLRFEQLEGNIFYAPVEPDYNIIALLAPHFADRLSDQNWVIHDIKRKIAAVYNQKDWIITDVASDIHTVNTQAEFDYQKLWKQYFKDICISYRVNPRLQRQHMPARYWRHLPEKQEQNL